ncbi:MAG: hypothetical protein WCK81_11340 [Betaproteobacteria bacterium]
MKNQLNNLSKALVAVAALTLGTGSAFAQLTVNGAIGAATCSLGVATTAAGTATTASTVVLPNVSLTAVNAVTAAGALADTRSQTTFFIKPTVPTCVSTGASGNFNVYFSSTAKDTTATTKAANVATASAASNLVIDLVPTTATTVATATSGMDITKLTSGTQHGIPAQALLTGSFSFNARYWKTSAAATTGTNVSALYTINGEYQ